MSVESRQFTPPAPEILKAGVIDNENRLYGEGELTATYEYVESIVSPLMEALTDPERYNRSTNYVDGVQQKDLWRKILNYPPKFRLDAKNYSIGITQIVDQDSKTTNMLFWTNVDRDNPTIAYLEAKMSDEWPYPRVNTGRNLANRQELVEIEAMAELVVSETPRQAITKGIISPNWMERYKWNPEDKQFGDLKEGFPTKTNYARPELYELITSTGERVVVRYDEQKKWIDDINPERGFGEADVVAWRGLGVIHPKYYNEVKWPSIYKD